MSEKDDSLPEPGEPSMQKRASVQPSPATSAGRLQVLQPVGGTGESCSCRRNEYIWDEEVELVQRMNGIKQQARDAHARGDSTALEALRTQFDQLRDRLAKVRRQRLDSFGWFDYD